MKFASRSLLPLIGAIAVSLSSPLSAAEKTWTGGGDTDWSNSSNWIPSAFADGDSILFDNLSTANLITNNNLSDQDVLGITVDDPAGDVTINGSPFTLGAGGIQLIGNRDLTMVSDPIGLGVLTPNIIGANQTWNIQEGRTLVMGAISNLAPATVTVQGGGLLRFFNNGNYFQSSPDWDGTLRIENSSLYTQIGVTFNTPLTLDDADRALGDGSTVVLDNADFHFAMNFDTSVNLKTHMVVESNSTVRLEQLSGTNSRGASIHVQSLTIGDSTLQVERINANAGGFLVGDLNVFSGSPLILTGTPVFVSDTPITFRGITDQGAGHGFIKRGAGTLSLSTGNYAFSGPITLEAGTLSIDRFGGTDVANKLGGANGHLTMLGGELTISDNSNRDFQTPVSIFTDTRILLPRSGNGAGVTATLGALTTDGREVEIQANAATTSGTARLRFGDATYTQGSTRFVLDRNGATALELDLAGNWNRQNRATVDFNLLTDNTTVTGIATDFYGGDFAALPGITVQANGEVQFGVQNLTNIQQLTSYTAFPTSGGDRNVAYSLDGGATLDGASGAYLLRIESTGAAQILDLGGNTLTVSYSDGFTSEQGAILFAGSDAYGVSNGIFSSAGQELIIHQHNTGGVTVSTTLDLGAGGLTKSGAGDLILTTAQSFTGDLTVNQGTLLLQSSASVNNTGVIRIANDAVLDVSGLSGFEVGASQSLVGTGSVAVGASDFVVSGEVAPGFSAGTLTFDSIGGDLVLNGILTMEVFGFETHEFDRLVLDGGTLQAGGILNLENEFLVGDLVAGTTLQLFSVSGDLFGGSFSQINGLEIGGGYQWDTSNLLINGTITAVPEPSSLLLLIGGAALLAYKRRRRLS